MRERYPEIQQGLHSIGTESPHIFSNEAYERFNRFLESYGLEYIEPGFSRVAARATSREIPPKLQGTVCKWEWTENGISRSFSIGSHQNYTEVAVWREACRRDHHDYFAPVHAADAEGFRWLFMTEVEEGLSDYMEAWMKQELRDRGWTARDIEVGRHGDRPVVYDYGRVARDGDDWRTDLDCLGAEIRAAPDIMSF
ncbi:MAG: hypothetical protein SVW77_03180 [Candidatus Nanohaloarchaea archaeon]|nr:hypothetical protein [Candidatus Nanohaloarchaea archaeon]